MRHLVLIACVSAGCAGPAPGGGDDDMQPDAGVVGRTCPLAMATSDTGALPALKAEMCNVQGSMGAAHWYRLSAALPGAAGDYVQVELWDGRGAFTGGTVRTGIFPISGNDADLTKCGVCVRGIGEKGATGTKEYFATGGMVNVTAVGANGTPISATLSNLTFVELDTGTLKPVSGGCMATVAATKIDGTVVQIGGGGGGGGGGGAGGSGNCATGVGD
jgi:hypothetical protein